MRTAIAAVVALSAVGTAPAAGQDPQWNRRGLDGGAVEFRLQNDDEAAINLVCHGQGVAVGFEFPTTLEPTERATVRSILSDTHQVGAQGHNDHRQNVAVARVGERVVRITSGRGTDMALQLLRDAAHLYLRVAGERATFSILGSDSVANECLLQQDEANLLPWSGGTWSAPHRPR